MEKVYHIRKNSSQHLLCRTIQNIEKGFDLDFNFRGGAPSVAGPFIPESDHEPVYIRSSLIRLPIWY